MDATRQLTQVGQPLREILLGDGKELARGSRVVLELAPDHAQPDRDRDEPLLCSVVQVALESPALAVADLHHARPGRGQLLVGVGVGQCLCDQLGKVAQPPLKTFGQRVLGRASPPPARPRACPRHSPGPPPRRGSQRLAPLRPASR